MYKPKYFKPQELVSADVYNQRGEKALQLLDDRILKAADYLRENLGPATINDWAWGGNNQSRGLRTMESPYYRPFSQHSHGRALDMIFRDVTAEQARQYIKENIKLIFAYSGLKSLTIEEGVSWLHIDCRNAGQGLNSFKP